MANPFKLIGTDTITLTGTGTGSMTWYGVYAWSSSVPPAPYPRNFIGMAQYSLASASWNAFGVNVQPTILATPSAGHNVGIIYSARVPGMSPVMVTDIYGLPDSSSGPTQTLTQALSASWYFSLDVEVWANVSEGVDRAGNPQDWPSNPDTGAAGVPDAPRQADLSVYYLPRVGGSARSGIGSASASTTITSGPNFAFVLSGDPGTWAVSLGATARASSHYIRTPEGDATVVGGGFTASMTGYLSGAGLSEAIQAGGETYSYDGCTAVANGCSATTRTADAVVYPTKVNTACACSVALLATPVKRTTLSGVLRADKNAYPASMTFRAYRPVGANVDLSGFGDTRTERYYIFNARAGENDADYGDPSGLTGTGGNVAASTVTVNEWGNGNTGVQVWLKDASLTAAGEDGRDWRVLIHGPSAPAMQISQAASIAIFSGSASATGPAHLTPALSNASLQGGRFLTLTFSVDTAGPFMVVIGGKTWTKDRTGAALAATTVSADYTIDLCDPTTPTTATDATDTRFPLPTVDGPLWGVTNGTGLYLSVASGTTGTLTGIRLVRRDHVKATVLPAFDAWVNDSGGSIDNRNDFLVGETDGRKSLECYDFRRDNSTGPGYIFRRLSEIVSDANATNDGWTATNLLPGDDGTTNLLNGYLNNGLPAAYLCGGGATVDASGVWTFWQDVDVSSPTSLPLQCLYDIVDLPPGAGNVLYGGSLGGPGILYAAKFLRGAAQGLVLDVATGTRVSVSNHTGGAAAGSGTTDGLGDYLTGLVYGNGGKTYDIVAALTGSPTLTKAFFSRKRHRASFRGVVMHPGRSVSYDVSDAIRHFRSFTQDMSIRLGVGLAVVPGGWNDRDTSIMGDEPHVRMDKTHRQQPVWIAYIAPGGAMVAQRTLDEGRSFDMSLTIASPPGSDPLGMGDFVITRDGRKYFYWRVKLGGGDFAIHTSVYDAANNVLIADTTIVASGVDDDCLAAKDFVTAGGVWRVGLFYRTGGSLTYITSSNGRSYA